MTEKGVVVEFDFAVLHGAELLFETAADYLKKLDGIRLDAITEARHLAGREYVDGLSRLFATVKTKKTAAKAARELEAAFNEAVTAALSAGLSASFRNFLNGLTNAGVRSVIATRADLDGPAGDVLRPLVSDRVSLYQDVSKVYGNFRCDAWRRACFAAKLGSGSVRIVTGSGFGVKSALMAGIGAVAVSNEHVAYQDFGGASEVVTELSGKTVRKVLGTLGISCG